MKSNDAVDSREARADGMECRRAVSGTVECRAVGYRKEIGKVFGGAFSGEAFGRDL